MLMNTGILFIKTFFMNICINYSFKKIINYKSTDKIDPIISFILNVIICTIYSIIFMTFLNSESNAIINITFYILYGLLLLLKHKISLLYGIVLICFSICCSFVSKFIAGSITFILIQSKLLKYGFWEYLILGIIQIIFIYSFFKMKRFKYGFAFLKEDNYKNNKQIYGIVISIITILACTLTSILKGYSLKTHFIFSFGIGSFLTIYCIKNEIINCYKRKMKDRTVEMLKEKIEEKDITINNLKEELSNVLKINHKYNHRISAMEKAIGKFENNILFNEEVAEEYGDISSSLNELSKEYKSNLYDATISNELPKTDIFSIDNILEYMKNEANKENIEFDLQINNNIKNLINNLITKSKLETLLVDHIKDAIIAIKASDSKYRKIKAILDISNNYNEIKILDTGKEFEIETLLKLGLEHITTHRDTGGSGIGFMTTFETLEECKGSLIIEEKHKMIDNDFTKAVIIRFDGKNEYKIRSYRADEIRKQINDNRIMIENL